MHSGRIGRRVVGLFILSALIPLTLCAAILFRQFSAELTDSERRSLDGLIRSFGMTVIGRIGSADDALKVLVSESGDDASVSENVANLGWIRGIQRIEPGELRAARHGAVPPPDERQLRALRDGKPAVIWSVVPGGNCRIFLVRALSGGAWLYLELDPDWLWGGASEFAGNASLFVLDNHNRVLTRAGTAPLPLRRSDPAADSPAVASPDPATLAAAPVSERWLYRSWELFLASRFSSPSWRIVAVRARPEPLSASNDSYLYLCGFILATILLIAGLSMIAIRRQLRPLGLLMRATEQVAVRNFEAFRGMHWKDEFGDLARSFSIMSEKLGTQFAALETLAEVDRMLLIAPKLELILDKLLPRIADLLRCQSVSVLLFDMDSDQHARAYDYFIAQPGQLPVRRIASEVAALRSLCDQASPCLLDAGGARRLSCVPPDCLRHVTAVRLLTLKNDGLCVGVLCLAYGNETLALQDFGMEAADFADRLSLILANLGQSERLRRQANFDPLTGLQNRRLFSESLARAVGGISGGTDMGGVLYIDLDHFKRINDTAGHPAGDALLRIVAERLMACVQDGQSVARLGGDEFAVLLPSIARPDVARRTAETIITSLQAPVRIDGREHHISASIGMAIFPGDGTTLEDLLKAADISMYHAKDAGRGRAVFFQAEMQQKLLERLELENGIRDALCNDVFRLHYQPILIESVPRMLGVEALARWPRADDSAWIPPGVFVPVAEDNGAIVELGDWVLRRACEQFAGWRREGVRINYISVNVSVRQLREPTFVPNLARRLRENRMQGKQLQIEITESVLAHGDELRETLEKIVALGVTLALDDFGTGYSSLSYLRVYPIHTVKIDRSFVIGLPDDAIACRLVESIVLMCAALGKTVVAEGVETVAQRQFLTRVGCPALQGYLLGRPMESGDIPGFARRLLSAAESDNGDCVIPPGEAAAS